MFRPVAVPLPDGAHGLAWSHARRWDNVLRSANVLWPGNALWQGNAPWQDEVPWRTRRNTIMTTIIRSQCELRHAYPEQGTTAAGARAVFPRVAFLVAAVFFLSGCASPSGTYGRASYHHGYASDSTVYVAHGVPDKVYRTRPAPVPVRPHARSRDHVVPGYPYVVVPGSSFGVERHQPHKAHRRNVHPHKAYPRKHYRSGKPPAYRPGARPPHRADRRSPHRADGRPPYRSRPWPPQYVTPPGSRHHHDGFRAHPRSHGGAGGSGMIYTRPSHR